MTVTNFECRVTNYEQTANRKVMKAVASCELRDNGKTKVKRAVYRHFFERQKTSQSPFPMIQGYFIFEFEDGKMG